MCRLKIWQQNINKSLAAQLDMLQSLKPRKYDIALIQEPYLNHNDRSLTNLQFTSVLPSAPPQHTPTQSQSLILVNTALPSDSWLPILLLSSDLMGVELRRPYRIIQIINVYNDGDNNNALDILL